MGGQGPHQHLGQRSSLLRAEAAEDRERAQWLSGWYPMWKSSACDCLLPAESETPQRNMGVAPHESEGAWPLARGLYGEPETLGYTTSSICH